MGGKEELASSIEALEKKLVLDCVVLDGCERWCRIDVAKQTGDGVVRRRKFNIEFHNAELKSKKRAQSNEYYTIPYAELTLCISSCMRCFLVSRVAPCGVNFRVQRSLYNISKFGFCCRTDRSTGGSMTVLICVYVQCSENTDAGGVDCGSRSVDGVGSIQEIVAWRNLPSTTRYRDRSRAWPYLNERSRSRFCGCLFTHALSI